jgi:HK97 gp10 family phage protein
MNEYAHEVKGLSELLRDLQTLPDRVERNVLRGALRKGMTVFQKAVKAKIPIGKDRKNWKGDLHRGGELARSVKMKAFNDPGLPRVKLFIGSYEAFYANIVEWGAKPHKTHIRGKTPINHPGFKGRFYVQNAFRSSEVAALEQFHTYLATRLPKELQKQSSG